MKSIYDMYEVSILADIDDQIDAYDNSIIDRIEKWIKENYDCIGLEISDNPNKDGLYEVSARSAEVKNKNITSLTNGMFEWVKAEYFYCSSCASLESLEGAPENVGGDFYCAYCSSIKSLEGAPKKVGGDFRCAYCSSLKSLEGAPKKVGGHFYCSKCTSLASLEGAPQEVKGYFDCDFCSLLTSLKGAPDKVGRDFYCYNCKKQFTEDDVRKVSNVKGKIVVK